MVINFILAIFCLAFGWLARRRPLFAGCLITAALPSYLVKFSLFGIPITLLEVMIIVLAAVIFANRLNRKRLVEFIKKNQVISWPAGAIIFFATIAMIISPNLRGAAGIWKAYFIEPVVFLASLAVIIKKPGEIKKLFWALGISAVYLSLFAWWQKFSGWGVPEAFLAADGSVDRVVSFFGYPNALGLYLGPIIILFSVFLWDTPKKAVWQLSKLAIIALSFSILVLAKSEAAILAILVVWLIAGVAIKKTRLIVLSFCLTGTIILICNPYIQEFFLQKILLQDYSGFIRRLIWKETWEMLKNNWLWGAGLAGYQKIIAPYHLPTFEIYLYPHNVFLNFWSELGLGGLIAFGWLAVAWLKKIFGEIKKNKAIFFNLAFGAAFLEIFIHGLVDVPYFKNDLSILFWLIIGLAIIANKVSKQG